MPVSIIIGDVPRVKSDLFSAESAFMSELQLVAWNTTGAPHAIIKVVKFAQNNAILD